MFSSVLIALLAMFGAIDDAKSNGVNPEDKFAGRKEARIPFASQLDHFQVKRENSEDILYLSTGFGHWYRAPLTCTGLGDPTYANGIVPVDAQMGVDKFTRFQFIGMGAIANPPCFISSLIELTPEETVELKLESRAMVDKRMAKEKEKSEKSKP